MIPNAEYLAALLRLKLLYRGTCEDYFRRQGLKSASAAHCDECRLSGVEAACNAIGIGDEELKRIFDEVEEAHLMGLEDEDDAECL